jgi:BirA family biotin operon repressor/biotin-[acetyl-CoA-carboxylase] ligase
MFEPLPDDVREALAGHETALGEFGRLRYRARVDSTNDIALALAAAGELEGASVLADSQRAGRGRRGREWFSPSGAGLYLSVIVGPDPAALSLVTLAAGVAAGRALRAHTHLPIELKWPNDVVVGRPWRKLGGILCETVAAGARIKAVVVGIGLNLRQTAYPPALRDRATAVELEIGRPIDRGRLLLTLLLELRAIMNVLHEGQYERLRMAWAELARAGLGGARVRWNDGAIERRGRAVDIDVDGALIVRSEGRTERLIAGEVTWEALSRA